jgi:hypothetical protein
VLIDQDRVDFAAAEERLQQRGLGVVGKLFDSGHGRQGFSKLAVTSHHSTMG